jgi:hypothetical protein
MIMILRSIKRGVELIFGALVLIIAGFYFAGPGWSLLIAAICILSLIVAFVYWCRDDLPIILLKLRLKREGFDGETIDRMVLEAALNNFVRACEERPEEFQAHFEPKPRWLAELRRGMTAKADR